MAASIDTKLAHASQAEIMRAQVFMPDAPSITERFKCIGNSTAQACGSFVIEGGTPARA